jgi:hypothetical protein
VACYILLTLSSNPFFEPARGANNAKNNQANQETKVIAKIQANFSLPLTLFDLKTKNTGITQKANIIKNIITGAIFILKNITPR